MNIVSFITLLTSLTLISDSLACSTETITEKQELERAFKEGSSALHVQKYKKAKSIFEKASAKGHSPSQAALGYIYFNGFGVDVDLKKARKLYELSAKGGSHQGLNNLAHLYRYGLAGLEKDLPKAIDLLEQAAKKDNYYAANTLSIIHRGNELGAPNHEKSILWLKFGSDRHNPLCLKDLAYCYEHGIGVDKDKTKAVTLYTQAINAGSSSALSNLGYMYLTASGVERSYPTAIKLFTEATAQQIPAGMINLAVMKVQGLGCKKDPKEAFELLKKAKALGSKEASQILSKWRPNQ